MGHRGTIKNATKSAAVKKTKWFRGSDIQAEVEEEVGKPVSVQRIGHYLGVIAEDLHFYTRRDPLHGKEYLPRVLIPRGD